MMNLSINFLDAEIQKLLDKLSFGERTMSLTAVILDSPTQYSDVFQFIDLTRILVKTKKKRELITLAIVSWYFPDTVRSLFQLNLKEHWDQVDRFSVEKEILLYSKTLCLAWILRESNWTASSFFGNILNKDLIDRLVSSLDFARIPRRSVKKYTGYCRGYQETHRRARSSVPRELYPWVLDQEIEEERQLSYHTRVSSCRERLIVYLKEEGLVA